jgi:PPOX class probable F420-dependent enzyme
MHLDSNELSHVLAVWPVARLATLSSGGRPGLVPIVFVALGDTIYSAIDGKPKSTSELQRLRNVARDPRATLLLDHYDEDWRALWWLRIDVRADVVDAVAVPAVEPALRAKYHQYRDVAVFRDSPRLLRMTIERHVAWSARAVNWRALRSGGMR